LREHGRLTLEAGQSVQGQSLLAAARSGFEKLGAQADAVAQVRGHGVRSVG
jgi:hypothetical protein